MAPRRFPGFPRFGKPVVSKRSGLPKYASRTLDGAVTLTLDALIKIDWDYIQAAALAPVQDKADFVPFTQWASGVGDGNVQLLYRAILSLTPGSPTVTLDLSGTTGDAVEDVFGRTLEFAYVNLLMVQNLGVPNGSGGYNIVPGQNVTIGNAFGTTADWASPFDGYHQGQLMIPPGGPPFLLGAMNLEFPVSPGISTAPGCLLQIGRTDGSFGSSSAIDVAVLIAGQ